MVDTSRLSGTRQSRSSRSRIGPGARAASVTPPSARPVRTQRQTFRAAPGVSRIRSDLTDSIRNFFGDATRDVVKASVEAVAERQKKATRDAITRATAEVQKRPEEAREAVLNNDFSGFIQEGIFIDEVAAQSAVTTMAADRAVASDVLELQEVLATATPGVDLEETVGDFISQKTEGMPDLYAAEYGVKMRDRSTGVVESVLRANQNTQTLKSISNFTIALRDGLSNGHIEPSLEALEEFRTQAIGSLPVPLPAAVQRANAAIEDELIDMAAEGNANALKMIYARDPANDGLSIADRRREDVEAAQVAAVQKSRRVNSMAAENDLQDLSLRVELYANGKAASGENLSKLWTSVLTYADKHGENDRYRAIRSKLIAMGEKQSTLSANLDRVSAGRSPYFSKNEWNEVGSQLFWGTGYEDWQLENGLSDEEANAVADRTLGQMGYPQKIKDFASGILLNASRPEDVQALLSQIEIHSAYAPFDREGHFVDGEAYDILMAMRAAKKSGFDPLQARAAILEGRREGVTGKPERYLENQLNGEGRKRGPDATFDMAPSVFADAIGSSFFTNDPDYSDIPPSLQEVIRDEINRAGYTLRGQTYDETQIKALAVERLRGRLGVQMLADGEIVPTLDRSPSRVRTPEGHVVQGVQIDRGYLERSREAVQASEETLALLGGEFRGLVQDELTGLGYGVAVLAENGTPLAATPGKIIAIPEGGVPTDHPFFQVENNVDGSQTIMVPDPAVVGNKVEIGDGLAILYSPEFNAWTWRAIDSGNDLSLGEALSTGDIPGSDDRGPRTAEELRADADLTRQVLIEARSRNVVRRGTRSTGDIESVLDEAVTETKKAGHDMDDILAGPEAQTRQVVLDFFNRQTGGGAPHLTDTGKPYRRWEGGRTKGDLVIAGGLWLKDGDAAKILKKAGTSPAELKSGKSLNYSQLNAVNGHLVDRALGYLKKHYADAGLREFEIKALVSILNSAPWSKGEPSILSSKARKALKDKDWEAFKEAIGNGGNDPVMNVRREAEFDLLLR